jgi:hypothetical protein
MVRFGQHEPGPQREYRASDLPAGWTTWHSPNGVDHVVPPRGTCATCGRDRHGAPFYGRVVIDVTLGTGLSKLYHAAMRANETGDATPLVVNGVHIATIVPAVTELAGDGGAS